MPEQPAQTNTEHHRARDDQRLIPHATVAALRTQRTAGACRTWHPGSRARHSSFGDHGAAVPHADTHRIMDARYCGLRCLVCNNSSFTAADSLHFAVPGQLGRRKQVSATIIGQCFIWDRLVLCLSTNGVASCPAPLGAAAPRQFKTRINQACICGKCQCLLPLWCCAAQGGMSRSSERPLLLRFAQARYKRQRLQRRQGSRQ